MGGLTAAMAVVVGPYMGLTADTFYHLSAANSLLARGTLLVTDPMYGTATTALDPTSGAWHTMLAFASRVTTLGPDWLWGGMTVVAATSLVLAFRVLVRTATGSARAATIATVAWLLFAQFADLRPAAYPKMGSLAIVFIALAAFVELLERPSWAAGGFAVIGGFAASVTHLGSAQLLYLGVGSIWLIAGLDAVVGRLRKEPDPFRKLRAVTAAAAGLAAAAVPAVLPRLGALGGGSGLGDVNRAGIEGAIARWPLGIVTARLGGFTGGGAWLAFLSIVLVLWMAWLVLGPARDRVSLGALGLAALPLLTIYDPVFATVLADYSPYVLQRSGALLLFASYLAIGWALATPERGLRPAAAPRWIGYAALVAAVWVSAVPLAGTFVTVAQKRLGNRFTVRVTRIADMHVAWGAGLDRLREAVDDRYPVIAGDPETVYYAAGLVRTAVVAAPRSHSPYVIEQATGPVRRADMASLLAAYTSVEKRRALLEEWHADFVLFWVTDRPTEKAAFAEMSGQRELFDVVFPPEGNGGLALLRVRR